MDASIQEGLLMVVGVVVVLGECLCLHDIIFERHLSFRHPEPVFCMQCATWDA